MDGQLNQQMYFQIEMQLKVSSSKGTLGSNLELYYDLCVLRGV